ncbi:hypothetical protein GCM10011608_37690 [Micromonospora sonchi]|uniref:HTH luxR-type domain-containing protein n=2 Tax=Micromonospora sonchi TaxID=1763543 RepID=A0A917U0G8_9ACTN|nr:hypothetical protein GCM10011608_37690 [Micromonospora sonchi]
MGRMPDDRSAARATTARRTAGSPVLASRLTPAAPPEPVVLRPRLARLLDDGVARPVTLLRAPAGWGKTTLLAAWRRAAVEAAPAAPAPAWVSVEFGDDSDRFWTYLAAALRSVADPDGDPAAAPPVPDRAPRPDELEVLAAALAARERPVVLILDDLHRITDPAALTGLEFLLRHTEQRLRLVAAGRANLPLAVQRLRLAGELTEIGPDELAFTGDEIADLLTAHGVAVPAAAVRRLRQRTEGWAAALRIAALALRDQPDPQRWIAGLGADQPEIAGYLREEVLAGLEAPDRELLRRAAVADTMCAGLAEALTGGADAETRLSALAENAGLLHHDGGRPAWYRCPPLLADLLRRELGRLPAEELRDLHLRAAGWYDGNGRPVDALRHAFAGGDWTRATDLFVTRWPDLVPYDRIVPTTAPPAPAPTEVVADAPELALAAAVQRALDGDADATREHLRLATAHARSLPEPRRARFGRLVAVVELVQARLAGEAEAVRAAAARLLATRDAAPAVGEPRADAGGDADVRAVAGTALALLALDAGDLDGAAAGFAAALTAAREAGRLRTELVCASRWALLAAVRGELRAAEEAARAALALPPCQGWSARVDCGYAYLALALVALHRDEPTEAEANLTLATAATREPPAGAVAAWCAAHLRSDEGDLAAAHRVLVAARAQWSDRSGTPAAATGLCADVDTWLRAAEVDLHSARDDTRTARDLAAAQQPPPHRPDPPTPHPPPAPVSGSPAEPDGAVLGSDVALAVAAARTEWRAGDPRAAARLLPDWDAAPADAWPLPVRLDAALLDALLAAGDGDDRRAGRTLERALDLAAPDGHRRPFTRGEPGLRALLSARLDAGTAHWSMVSDLVRAVEVPAERAPAGALVAPLDEPLTERELIILRYLQSILSNVEIAAELSVSVNTVKTHVRNIYRKLGAVRRRDAVRRARALHLI